MGRVDSNFVKVGKGIPNFSKTILDLLAVGVETSLDVTIIEHMQQNYTIRNGLTFWG